MDGDREGLKMLWECIIWRRNVWQETTKFFTVDVAQEVSYEARHFSIGNTGDGSAHYILNE